MNLFTTRQIAEIDRYTIEHEPISDIDLMERASLAITDRLIRLTGRHHKLVFLAGSGNNGGDALAVARLISEAGYPCEVYLPDWGKPGSPSQQINLQRLKTQAKATILSITSENDFPRPEPGSIIIDGLFGSGLTRPLGGLAAALVRHINRVSSGRQETGDGRPETGDGRRETGNGRRETGDRRNPKSEILVVSIDIPSGLMGEDNSGNNPEHIIRADVTITLQFPKISLLFPENEQFAGEVFVEEIGLHPEPLRSLGTPYRLSDKETVYRWFRPRARFSHKGDYGHALLVAGSFGKMGAALLASEACLKTGAGLVTTHLPGCGYEIQQTYRPEVMCSIDVHAHMVTTIPPLEPYRAVMAGPGLGTHPVTREALLHLLRSVQVPLVLDADALNILSFHPEWLAELPAGTILTPHPGEFRRLFGETTGSWQRLQLMRSQAEVLGVVIVLKGAYTAIALPDGKVIFNTTGNPGMATGGSGDVLSGIITGLLSRGYTPEMAACAGVFIHGEAGDKAAARFSQEAMTASDITGALADVFQNITEWQKS